MVRYLKLFPLMIILVIPGCFHLQNEPEKELEKTSDIKDQATPFVDNSIEKITEEEITDSKIDSSATSTDQGFIQSDILNIPQDEFVGSEEPKNRGPYRLNIGDVLEISVLDEPEMTRNVAIIPDGTIAYLLVGEIKAEGLTIAELRASLTVALKEFFIAPYVSVLTQKINLPQEEVKKISILGALKAPGNYDWHKGNRILDILAQAGGLLYTQTDIGSRATANLKASYLSRNGKAVDVDFYKLMILGDMRYNIPVHPNDFIYIADAGESTIIVMGEVNAPRIIPYTRDFTLVEALSVCRGFTRDAYKSRVIIIRTPLGGETKYVEVDVNDLLHGKDIKNLMLQSGDIVYVPEQTLSEYARWAGYLSDIAGLILKAYQVKDAIRFPQLKRE